MGARESKSNVRMEGINLLVDKPDKPSELTKT